MKRIIFTITLASLIFTGTYLSVDASSLDELTSNNVTYVQDDTSELNAESGDVTNSLIEEIEAVGISEIDSEVIEIDGTDFIVESELVADDTYAISVASSVEAVPDIEARGSCTSSQKTIVDYQYFYVFHDAYLDHVGTYRQYFEQKKSCTSTKQPYYTYYSPYSKSVTYKEDGFSATSSNSISNTSTYKKNSTQKLSYKWSSYLFPGYGYDSETYKAPSNQWKIKK